MMLEELCELIEESSLDLRGETLRALSGGDTAQVYRIEDAEGRSYVLKRMPREAFVQLQAEARGLQELTSFCDEQMHVPAVHALFEIRNTSLLVLEYVRRHDASELSYELFGRSLAGLHQASRRAGCGFPVATWIGRTVQDNSFSASWSSFFTRSRLSPMVSSLLARDSLPSSLARRLERIIVCSDELTGGLASCSLLHGDLWGGNHFFDSQGKVVLFDPACYYGDPLADIALTELFSPFPAAFYGAYFEASGEDRGRYAQVADLYRLYHGLNHLLLFGSSYLRMVSCLAAAVPL